MRSRSSFKLLQAVKKYQFIKPGNLVIDIGAAPGGWTQAALQLVGDSGFVLAIDNRPIEKFHAKNVNTIIGDITDLTITHKIKDLLSRPVDAVISDVAPNLSGTWELDHSRQMDLANHSLKIAISTLKTGGNFFVKGFQGKILYRLIDEVKEFFTFVKLVKPKASRLRSAELYILGMNYKPKNK